ELQTSLAQLARGDTNVRFPAARHAELGAIVTALEDTTLALRKREQRLLHLANHDQLTGLPNRHRFVAELDAELGRATPTGARGASCISPIATSPRACRAATASSRGATRGSAAPHPPALAVLCSSSTSISSSTSTTPAATRRAITCSHSPRSSCATRSARKTC